MSACLHKDPGARPSALVVARALRDPALLREPAYGQTGAYGSAYDGSLVPAGSTSGPVTNGHRVSSAYPTSAGPATASVRVPAMAASAGPATGAVAMGMAAPETDVPLRGASPETEVAFAGLGGAGAPPRPGRRARHRDARSLRIRPVWAAVAAVVLVFAGVAGTYLASSGGTAGQAAGPVASPLVASTQSKGAAVAGSASPAASHRTTPSARPSATTQAAPAATPAAVTTPASAPSSAVPAGTPVAPGPTGPNLVADGDFTDSSLSAWNDQVLNTIVVSAGSRGGYAAQMTGQPTAGVTQILTGLKPGTEYELTGWIISDTDNYSTYVGVKDYDSTAGVSHALNSSTWAETAMTFIPAAGHTTAEVFCWQAVQGTGYCTDVSVRAMS
jgi:hypothetical protein